MTAAVRSAINIQRDQHSTVIGAVVYSSYGARLFTAQRPPRISEYAEENIIYLYAAVNLKRK